MANLFTPLSGNAAPPAFLSGAATALAECAAVPWMGVRLPYVAAADEAAPANAGPAPADAAAPVTGAVGLDAARTLRSSAELEQHAEVLIAQTGARGHTSAMNDPERAPLHAQAPPTSPDVIAHAAAGDGERGAIAPGAPLAGDGMAAGRAQQPDCSQPTTPPLAEPLSSANDASPGEPAGVERASPARSGDHETAMHATAASSERSEARQHVARGATRCGGRKVASQTLRGREAVAVVPSADAVRRGLAAAEASQSSGGEGGDTTQCVRAALQEDLAARIEACPPPSEAHAAQRASLAGARRSSSPPARSMQQRAEPKQSPKRPQRASQSHDRVEALRLPGGCLPASAIAVRRKKQRTSQGAVTLATGPLQGDGASAARADARMGVQHGEDDEEGSRVGTGGSPAEPSAAQRTAQGGGARKGAPHADPMPHAHQSACPRRADGASTSAAAGSGQSTPKSASKASRPGGKRRKTSDAGAPWLQRSILEFATHAPLSASPAAPLTRSRGQAGTGSGSGMRDRCGACGPEAPCVAVPTVETRVTEVGDPPREVVDLCTSDDD